MGDQKDTFFGFIDEEGNFKLKKARVTLQDCRRGGVATSKKNVMIEKETHSILPENVKSSDEKTGVKRKNTEATSFHAEKKKKPDDDSSTEEESEDSESSCSDSDSDMDSKPLKCKECDRRFKRKDKLTEHSHTHETIRKDKVIGCVHCGQMFSRKETLKRHLEKMHSEVPRPKVKKPRPTADPNLKPYTCDLCDRQFRFKSKLEEHSRSHEDTSEKTMSECLCCGMQFSRKATLRRHMENIHLQDPAEKEAPRAEHRCDVCGKDFTNAHYVAQHVKVVHEKERPHQCAKCPKRFAGKALLAAHMRKVHDETRFQCQKCDQGFRTRPLLNSHVRAEHPTAEEEVNSLREINTLNMTEEEKMELLEELEEKHRGVEICTLCDKSKPTQAHLMLHLDIKPFECEECGKCFRYKTSLQIHFRTHTGQVVSKSYKCKVCGKTLSTSSTLSAHVRRHGSPKFECDSCDKKFFTKFELRQHTQLHEDTKPFCCDKCKKSFKTQRALERHSAVHVNERRFECDECDQKFKHYMQLKAHKQKHSGNREK